MTLLEICVDDVKGVRAARDAGADRAELCADLEVGGTTPPLEQVRRALEVAPAGGLQVIVRPRGGDFVHSEAEVREMLASIHRLKEVEGDALREARARGAQLPPLGFVVGVLTPDGRIDSAQAARLREAAGAAPLTFHRAFDVVCDPAEALETLVGLGFDRVLTTGGHPSAADTATLAELTRRAAGRLGVIASGGVREANVVEVLRASGAPEVHMRCPREQGGTDAELARRIVALVRAHDAAASQCDEDEDAGRDATPRTGDVLVAGGARAEVLRPLTRPGGRALRIGVSGGIGSGKSSVSRALAAHGAVVADADALAREVVAPGSLGLRKVVERFGPAVLGEDGSLDRGALGAIVFADPAARRDLEAITHPLIGMAAEEILGAAPAGGLAVHDVPLLVETGMEGEVDLVLMVDAAVEARLERLRRRGVPAEDARARMAAQADAERRRAVAHVWVDNSGTEEDLAALVDAIAKQWLRL